MTRDSVCQHGSTRKSHKEEIRIVDHVRSHPVRSLDDWSSQSSHRPHRVRIDSYMLRILFRSGDPLARVVRKRANFVIHCFFFF